MRTPDTHVHVILDRTGSMASIRDDVIGGFNAFLEEQKSAKGKATFTLVQFDSQDPYEIVHHFLPIEKVPPLTPETYIPRASTPLLDAIGRGILHLEQELKTQKLTPRVVMAIITDGYENASKEYTKAQITQMIKEKREKDSWQFVFLSADLDAIHDSTHLGFRYQSTLGFDRTSEGTRHAFRSFSSKLLHLLQHMALQIEFDQKDRQRQQLEQKREDRPSKKFGKGSK